MHDFAREFPPHPSRIHGPANLGQLLQVLHLQAPTDLGSPDVGEPVATARSSWVRRVVHGSIDCHIKTYVYTSWRDRWRGALRNTGPWCQSRAAREAAALQWLAMRGFPGPAVVGVVEERRLGFVVRAILVTTTWPGEPLDRLLPRLEVQERDRFAAALGAFVAALHAAGFRDGNLDLRNVLAHRDGERIALCKIDSPRFRLARPSVAADGRSRADWDRLLPQLQALGLAAAALAAAREPQTNDPRAS